VAKILVADDNSNIQKMVGLALKDQGIDVVAVGNGEAAVRKIADIRPDLVLADVFMPVRNGYEVCRYVKEDPNFSHIPVILLVGAFDPLDEQEAQRVGADGVLKKPFVPPDPLISMVKSALARAGVLTGMAAQGEKAPEPLAPPVVELMNPAVRPRLAALAPEKIAEVEPEPIDDFPTSPEQVRIAAGHQPVAFGSLLETPEVEDDAAFLPKGRGDVEERSWGVEETEELEVAEEEESPQGGWRKDGHSVAAEETEETAGRVSDWRDTAFHEDSRAASLKSSRWTPAVEQPSLAEGVHSPAVAVSTLDEKPADAPAPFSGDAWAAAMAAGVEEKLAQAQEAVEAKEPQNTAEAKRIVEEAALTAPIPEAPAEEPGKATASSNEWYSVSSSPWDAEAKKASLLAATWDVPAEESAPAVVERAESVVKEAAAPVAEEESHYAGSPTETIVENHERFVENETEIQVEAFTATPEEAPIEAFQETQAADARQSELAESSYTAELPVEEMPGEALAPVTESKIWGNTWETAASLPAENFAEVGQETAPQLGEEHVAPAQDVPVVVETGQEAAPTVAPVSDSNAAPAEPVAAKPDMDTLIARVLEKMNPEVLQKMTHEFLRPVIEAIIQNELNSKKP
jgi:CheY-like chemotaxis protein